jgi:hypothetical protein
MNKYKTIFTTTTEAYHINARHNGETLIIDFIVLDGLLYTSCFPQTQEILLSVFPEVLQTQCFNENNEDFFTEVANTEIAHLYEHMILSNLQNECCSNDIDVNGDFSGFTEWNWKTSPRGTFRIVIKTLNADTKCIVNSMEKSLSVLESVRVNSVVNI